MNANVKHGLVEGVERLLDMPGAEGTASYDYAQFTLESFVEWVEGRRNTTIIMVGIRMPIGIFGAWITSPEVQLILYDKRTPPIQQVHIILHEVGHLYIEHDTAKVTTEKITEILTELVNESRPYEEILAPYLNITRRMTLKDRREQEAEVFALLVQARVRVERAKASLARGSSDERMREVLRQLGSIE